jgi:hypothetical protein
VGGGCGGRGRRAAMAGDTCALCAAPQVLLGPVARTWGRAFVLPPPSPRDRIQPWRSSQLLIPAEIASEGKCMGQSREYFPRCQLKLPAECLLLCYAEAEKLMFLGRQMSFMLFGADVPSIALSHNFVFPINSLISIG